MTAVKLHSVDGRLWVSEGSKIEQIPQTSAAAYVVQAKWQGIKHVRIVGSRSNSELIALVYRKQLLAENQRFKTQLCSPRFVTDSEDPEEFFRQMDSIEAAPSVGGWHVMQPPEYAAYSLITATRTYDEKSLTAWMPTLMKAHPAYSAVTFGSSVSLVHAAHVLSVIGDPRWHVDPVKPDRTAKLKNVFGFGAPRNAARITNAIMGKLEDAKTTATSLVINAWFGGSNTCDGYLGKIMLQHKDKPEVGLYRASQVYLRLISAVWLHNLRPERKYANVRCTLGSKSSEQLSRVKMLPCASYSPTLFVPEYFFKDSAIAGAWREHVANIYR